MSVACSSIRVWRGGEDAGLRLRWVRRSRERNRAGRWRRRRNRKSIFVLLPGPNDDGSGTWRYKGQRPCDALVCRYSVVMAVIRCRGTRTWRLAVWRQGIQGTSCPERLGNAERAGGLPIVFPCYNDDTLVPNLAISSISSIVSLSL